MRYHGRIVYEDIPVSEPTIARSFREVIEAVQNGLEEMGESPSKAEYDFKKPEDVDFSTEPVIFVEKQGDLGATMDMNGNFEDRLADRIGFVKPESTEPTPSE